jgi:hypothetical protein
MFRPTLRPWIEERCTFTGKWVWGLGTITFEVVASMTCQPEILANSIAAQCFRCEVVDVQRHAQEGLWRMAIATARLRILANLSA